MEDAAVPILVGRVGRTAAITSRVRWLLCEDAGWTTGQVIPPDGGAVLVH